MPAANRKSPRQSLAERLERSRKHRQWLAKDGTASVGGGSTDGSHGTTQSDASKSRGTAASNDANNYGRRTTQSSSSSATQNNNGEERESLASRRTKAMQMGRKRAHYTTPPPPPPPPPPAPVNNKPVSESNAPPTAPVSTVPRFTPRVKAPVKRDIPNTITPSLTIDTNDTVDDPRMQARSPAMQSHSQCESMLYQTGAMDESQDDTPALSNDDEEPFDQNTDESFSRPTNSFHNPPQNEPPPSSYTQGRHVASSYSGNVQPKPVSKVTPSWVKKTTPSNDDNHEVEQSTPIPKRNFVQPKQGTVAAPSWAKRSEQNNAADPPSSTTSSRVERKWTPNQGRQSPQGQQDSPIVRRGSWSSPREAPRPSPMSLSKPSYQLGSPRNQAPTEEAQRANATKVQQGSSIETPDVMSVASLRASFNSRGSNQPIMPMNSPDPRVRLSFPAMSPSPMFPKSPRQSWQSGRSHAPIATTRTPAADRLPPTSISSTSPSNGGQKYGSTGKFTTPSKLSMNEGHIPVGDGQVDWPSGETETLEEEQRPPPSAVKKWQAKQGAPSHVASSTSDTQDLQETPIRGRSTDQPRATPSVLKMWQAKQGAPNSSADAIRRAEVDAAVDPEHQSSEASWGEGSSTHQGRSAPSVLKKWQAKQGAPTTATDTIRRAEAEAAVDPEPQSSEVPWGEGSSTHQGRATPSVLTKWQAKQGTSTEVEAASDPEPRLSEASWEGANTYQGRAAPSVLKMWQAKQGAPNSSTDAIRRAEVEAAADPEPRSSEASWEGGNTHQVRTTPSVLKKWQAKQRAPNSSTDATRRAEVEVAADAELESAMQSEGVNTHRGRAGPSVLNTWQAKQGAPNSSTEAIRRAEVEAADPEPESEASWGGGNNSTNEGSAAPSVLKMWQAKQGATNTSTDAIRRVEVEAAYDPEPEPTMQWEGEKPHQASAAPDVLGIRQVERHAEQDAPDSLIDAVRRAEVEEAADPEIESELQWGGGNTHRERAAPSVLKMWQAKQGAPNSSTDAIRRAEAEAAADPEPGPEPEGEREGGNLDQVRAAPSVLKMWQAKQGAPPNSATDAIRRAEIEAAADPEPRSSEASWEGGNTHEVRTAPSVLEMRQTEQGATDDSKDAIRRAKIEAAVEQNLDAPMEIGDTDEELRPSNVLKMWQTKMGAKHGSKPEPNLIGDVHKGNTNGEHQPPSDVVNSWQSKPGIEIEMTARAVANRHDHFASMPFNQEKTVGSTAVDRAVMEEAHERVNQELVLPGQKAVVVVPEEPTEESFVDEATRALYSNRARQMQKGYSKAPWQHDSSPRRANNDRESSSLWRAKAEATSYGANAQSRSPVIAEHEIQALGPAILPETSSPKVPPMFSKTGPKTESPNTTFLKSQEAELVSGDGPHEVEHYPDEIERRALEIVGKLNRSMPPSNDIGVVEEKKSSDDLVVQSGNDTGEDHSTPLARMAAESSLVADFEEVMKHASKPGGSFDENSSTNSENPSALPEDLPDEFQRVLSSKNENEYHHGVLGVNNPFSMQIENASPPRLAIKHSDSTSAYIEDENYVDDDEGWNGEHASPTRLTIKQSDSTSAYIEDDSNHNRGGMSPRDVPPLNDALFSSTQHRVPAGQHDQAPANINEQRLEHSNILSPTKSMDSSNYPVLTPSRRDSEAYRMGYYGDVSPRGKMRGNSPPNDHSSNTPPPLRTVKQSPHGSKGRPKQVDQVLRFWAKDTASEDEHDEALHFTGEEEWLDKDPDLDPFADDDSVPQENKGPGKAIRFSDPPASEAMMPNEKFAVSRRSTAAVPSRGAKGHSPKRFGGSSSSKKKQEKVVFDPFADDDEDGLVLDNPDDFFSPDSADPFMSAESFSPLNWGTPRSQEVPDFNHADLSPEFQVGFEI